MDASGAVLTTICYSYDADGHVHTVERNINGKQAVDTHIYDSCGREISHEDAAGAITLTKYEENTSNEFGQLVLKETIKDPQDISTIETYDHYGRVAKIEKRNANTDVIAAEALWYDACGNLVLQQDHVYQGTNYIKTKSVSSIYDYSNRIKSMIRAFGSSDERTTAYEYTLSGKLAIKVQPDGTKLKYTYDSLDHLKSLQSSDDTIAHTFNYNLLGQLISATDEITGIKVDRVLNAHGNVVQETLSKNITIKKTYDFLQRPLSLDLPDGGKIVYVYDPLFLRSIKRLNSSDEQLYEHRYEDYDLNGHVLKESMINQLGLVTRETDVKGQFTAIQSDYFSQHCFFDNVGNLKNQIVNGLTEDFDYDDLSQLISEANHNYVYDSTFNRLEDTGIKCQHNLLDEQLSNGEVACKYDLRGNLIEKSTDKCSETFVYDALNRLIEGSSGNKKVRYFYDPLYRKLGKSLVSLDGEWKEQIRENFLYDGNNDIGTISQDGKIKELRILGTGKHPVLPETVAVEIDGKSYASCLDCQGNIRSLIDISTKLVAATYDYDAFGK